jgi:hypothetical protein
MSKLAEQLRTQAEKLTKTADALDAIESAQIVLDKALASFPRFEEPATKPRGLNCLLPTEGSVART